MIETQDDKTLVKDDDTLDRTNWRPSDEQIAAFTQREVEMCVAAIQRDKGLRAENSLFSYKTWQRALLNAPKDL